MSASTAQQRADQSRLCSHRPVRGEPAAARIGRKRNVRLSELTVLSVMVVRQQVRRSEWAGPADRNEQAAGGMPIK
jgi:hypothetical protein